MKIDNTYEYMHISYSLQKNINKIPEGKSNRCHCMCPVHLTDATDVV